MSNPKMHLWDQVQQSDPASLKEVSFGRKFTAISANHQIKRATEIFGQFGKGWGVQSEVFTRIHDNLLLYQAMLWYKDSDDVTDPINSFGISASIEMVSSKGRLDDECAKKVATDALTKGLSKLGFNADIFLGMWDDNKYVNRVTAEAKKKADSDNAAEIKAEKVRIAKEKKETEDVIKQFIADMDKRAKVGDAKGIGEIWTNNVPLQKNTAFKSAVSKAGATAKAFNAKSETSDEGSK